jgi:AcrR family transcriptional regulator
VAGRRQDVLASAVRTFAARGYRATSMDAVAREARISRPGLYFLFSSKSALFREAVAHLLADDLTVVEQVLSERERPLADRLVDAFDRWAGRWVGPPAADVPRVIADNPELLDPTAQAAPARFEALVTAAVTEQVPDAEPVVATLVSVSVGLKHQVATREEYLRRFRAAVTLLVR